MKTFNVFLGLGSNLGEREHYLQKAASGIKNLLDVKAIWVSPVYESDPWGKTDQPKFLNACMEIETALRPTELMTKVKALEENLGRSSREHWGPREIDIDVLVYDGLVFEDGTVTVPHPEMEKRRFVLVPLREIAPDLVHPVSGLTVEELATACRDITKVMKTIHHILL